MRSKWDAPPLLVWKQTVHHYGEQSCFLKILSHTCESAIPSCVLIWGTLMRSWGRALLMDQDPYGKRRGPSSVCPSVSMPWGKARMSASSCLETRKQVPTRSWVHRDLDLGLSSLQNWENSISAVWAPRRWYFVSSLSWRTWTLWTDSLVECMANLSRLETQR